MNFSLVTDYSSEEEKDTHVSDASDDEGEPSPPKENIATINLRPPEYSKASSLLPSPEDLFSEITGPPKFLTSTATEPICTRPQDSWRIVPEISRTSNYNRPHPAADVRHTPPGSIFEAKAKLVNSQGHDEGNSEVGVHEVTTAPASRMSFNEETEALSRICLKCGVPKTSSGVNGTSVCPICGPAGNLEMNGTAETDKRKPKIKDKEKSKRMKGQSSHATWKSETEMQLRQQFD